MKLKKTLALLLTACMVVPSPFVSHAEELPTGEQQECSEVDGKTVDEEVSAEESEEQITEEQTELTSVAEQEEAELPADQVPSQEETQKKEADEVVEATEDSEPAETQEQPTEEEAVETEIFGGAESNPVEAVLVDDVEAYTVNAANAVSESGVVKVDDTFYDSIEAAIEATKEQSGNVTITLQDTVEEDVVIPKNRTVTLDLNGNELRSTETGDTYTIDNKGNLTITDTWNDSNECTEDDYQGCVTNHLYTGVAIVYNEPGAAATLRNVKISRGEEPGYAIWNLGEMTIENSQVFTDVPDESPGCIENGWPDGADHKEGDSAVLTIRSALVSIGDHEESTVKNDEYGELIIEDGTFINKSDSHCVIWNTNKATIKGGRFESQSDYVIHNTSGDLKIEDGEFEWLRADKGTSDTIIYADEGQEGTITVSGGRFQYPCKDTYLVEGCQFVEDGNFYKVKEFPEIAQIGDIRYRSMEAAVAAAGDKDTITILDEIVLDKALQIPADKSLTLELNGNVVQSSETPEEYIMTVAGSLTIKDSVGSGQILSKKRGIQVSEGGTLTVDAGVIQSYDAPVSSTENSSIIIHGGTLSAEYGAAIEMKQGSLTITDGIMNGGISLRAGTVNISGGVMNAVTEWDKIHWPKEYYNRDVEQWFPDALYVLGGISASDLNLHITGGTFISEYGSAVAVYDLGKAEQNISVDISGDTGLYNEYNQRQAYQVVTLEDIWVQNPTDGYGNVPGKITSSLSGGYYGFDDAYSGEDSKPDESCIKDGYECVRGSYPWQGRTYGYKIVPEGTLAHVEIQMDDPEVGQDAPWEHPEDYTTEDEYNLACEMYNIASSIEVGKQEVNECVDKVRASLAQKGEETEERAVQALEEADIEIYEGAVITTIVVPYFKTKVLRISGEPGNKEIEMDISMYYKVIATTNPLYWDLEWNAVVLEEPVKVSDADTMGRKFEISLTAPENYFDKNNTDNYYIKHVKEDGTVYYHALTIEYRLKSLDDAIIYFTNDKGFSTFGIQSVDKTAAISYDSDAGSKTYLPTDVNLAMLPTVSKEGYAFKGWNFALDDKKISGIYSGVLTEELFEELAALCGNDAEKVIQATAEWEKIEPDNTDSDTDSEPKPEPKPTPDPDTNNEPKPEPKPAPDPVPNPIPNSGINTDANDAADSGSGTENNVKNETVSGKKRHKHSNSDTSETAAAVVDSARTGDDANIVLWIILMILAGAGTAGFLVYTKRKKYNNQNM